MKKKVIQIAVAIIILALLIVAYYFGTKKNDTQNNDNQNQQSTTLSEDTQSNAYPLINKDISLFKESSIENGLSIITLSDGTFSVKGHEDYKFSQENLSAIVNSLTNISSNDKIDPTSDLAQYGLDKPALTVNVAFNDNTTSTIYLGNPTPDKMYYYVMINDDKNIYLLDNTNAQRYYYTLDNVIDKTMTQISMYEAYYIYINQKDKPLIEISFDEKASSEGNAGQLSSYGMQTLTMHSPYKGLMVYPYNLESTILKSLPNLQLQDLIEATPSDLSKYGLDKPSLEVKLKDKNNSLRLLIGKDSVNSDGTVYCMVDDRPHVFSIKKEFIEPFMNSNPITYIEKFVALKTRIDTKEVSISSGNDTYTITFADNPDASTTDDEKTKKVDKRIPYINSKEIEKSAFDNYYETVIGITFDSIKEGLTASGAPDVTMKFSMLDNSIATVKYYNYPDNTNFYIAEVDGNARYLVSKQTVKNLLDATKKLVQ